ncbi:hypothetical protein [Psychromarinibacter halotolerans]|uniref:DUF4148 domain-containing protein n=1 Tax=Psychromarinibacter halotolerans TaxID=1775175 RepID=A0ABV7GRT4_9RHOB|nr:hypothetical protein [Psychromarinibacter halotolerans]MAQ86173.1 hypothetical protein [Maritimibacter sp.]MDF0596676.1 hypothetical protein [Psychromarinibacter halotolerans]
MKFVALAAAAAMTLASAATTASAQEGRYYSYGPKIKVSCFRGPWKEVIWDRPNPEFIDSLVAAGYDYPTAHAMAERVCRDRAGVGNSAALRETARSVLRGY